jgi:hypothetical protein
MLHSALNFATGFFGIPIEGKYLQSIMIEAPEKVRLSWPVSVLPLKLLSVQQYTCPIRNVSQRITTLSASADLELGVPTPESTPKQAVRCTTSGSGRIPTCSRHLQG